MKLAEVITELKIADSSRSPAAPVAVGEPAGPLVAAALAARAPILPPRLASDKDDNSEVLQTAEFFASLVEYVQALLAYTAEVMLGDATLTAQGLVRTPLFSPFFGGDLTLRRPAFLSPSSRHRALAPKLPPFSGQAATPDGPRLCDARGSSA